MDPIRGSHWGGSVGASRFEHFWCDRPRARAFFTCEKFCVATPLVVPPALWSHLARDPPGPHSYQILRFRIRPTHLCIVPFAFPRERNHDVRTRGCLCFLNLATTRDRLRSSKTHWGIFGPMFLRFLSDPIGSPPLAFPCLGGGERAGKLSKTLNCFEINLLFSDFLMRGDV